MSHEDNTQANETERRAQAARVHQNHYLQDVHVPYLPGSESAVPDAPHRNAKGVHRRPGCQ